MGFSTVFTNIANNGMTNAASLLSDVQPVVAVVFAVGVVALVAGALRRFL